MSNLQPIRGMKDLIGEEAQAFAHVVKTAKQVATAYHFKPIQTPIMEFTDVFARTLGETSDVVNKEMYTFEDRNGESLTLRPEFTAGIARAFISNGLQQYLPLKLFSYGPLFRYERPQKGRQRQFHQVNCEYLGNASPLADVEMIALADAMLKALGIEDYEIALNSLGDAESRAAYREALVAYLTPYKAELSEDSQKRLKTNPMRVLDSKDEGDKKITAEAPGMEAYYNEVSQAHSDKVKEGLEALGIAYTLDTNIVRGLDYYTHTVFEFISGDDQLGAQNTILAGGRYDGLIAQMGGPDTPAVGFASGIERLMLVMDAVEAPSPPIAVLPKGEVQELAGLAVVQKLREAGHVSELLLQGNFGKRMKKSNKMGAENIIVIQEDGTLEIKGSLEDAIRKAVA